MLCGSLDGSGVWGGVEWRMDTSVCMTESLGYSPETIIMLLISYAPRKN